MLTFNRNSSDWAASVNSQGRVSSRECSSWYDIPPTFANKPNQNYPKYKNSDVPIRLPFTSSSVILWCTPAVEWPHPTSSKFMASYLCMAWRYVTIKLESWQVLGKCWFHDNVRVILQIRESEEEWGVPHSFTLYGQRQSVVVAARYTPTHTRAHKRWPNCGTKSPAVTELEELICSCAVSLME